MKLAVERAGLVAAGVLAACSAGVVAACSTRTEAIESVVLVTCDTLRADHLGCYGATGETSPRLDALAAEALVFESAFAQAPMTRPSLASLMTGRMPAEVGAVPANDGVLGPEARTLAELVSEAGIQTAAVVSNGILQGATSEVGLAQGFDTWNDHMPARERNRQLYERIARGTSGAAIDWLRLEARPPFFLWVHYQDPHGPYTPPPAHVVEAPAGGEPGPSLRLGRSESGVGQIPRYQQIDGEDRADAYRARYAGEVRYFDHELGKLLDTLRERDLYERTLLIVTADHGESLGEHDHWFTHGENLLVEVVRVPLLVRSPVPLGALAPDPLPRGRIREPIAVVDLFPTVLDALSVPAPASRGHSLFAAERPTDRVVPQHLALPGQPEWHAATDGRYRLVWRASGEAPALFDLDEDPGETVDLYAERGAVVERLRAGHEAFHAQELAPAAGLTLDEARRAALEALGYGGADDD